ncbi:hypothetical protein [Streptomyces sp. enrichment culture]|uniref:hypothetical protein n=1 Tax=Streptomyces sp. enrichment culture TaxID=1795815 RepID=UPI003F54A29F
MAWIHWSARRDKRVLDGLVTDWLEPLARAELATGADPATTRNRARLGPATVRGLLLDLLATGDRVGVDAAMEEFLRLYYPPSDNATDRRSRIT